jgi:hypothetical protein
VTLREGERERVRERGRERERREREGGRERETQFQSLHAVAGAARLASQALPQRSILLQQAQSQVGASRQNG